MKLHELAYEALLAWEAAGILAKEILPKEEESNIPQLQRMIIGSKIGVAIATYIIESQTDRHKQGNTNTRTDQRTN